jgi:tetratricopeptide (TPR) repeat protein
VRSAYGVTRAPAGGPLEEAIACRQEAQELARQAGNLELQVSVSPGVFLAPAGRNREAELDRVLEAGRDDYQLGRQLIGVSAVILAIVYRTLPLLELGRLAEARAAIEDALRLAREHDDVECLAYAQAAHGGLSYFTGEPGDALSHARAGLELAERLGSSFSRVVARSYLSFAHLARGEHDDALVQASEALKIMRETRTVLALESGALSAVAQARLGLDDLAGARAAAAEGSVIAAKRGTRLQEVACRWMLARALLLACSSRQRSEAHVQRVVAAAVWCVRHTITAGQRHRILVASTGAEHASVAKLGREAGLALAGVVRGASGDHIAAR